MLALAFLVATAAGAPDPPPELQAYYRDHNFVYSFSTVAERRTAAQSADPRLRRVAAAMQRMELHILDVDPGMVRPVLPRSPAGQPLADSAAVQRSDVVHITGIRIDEDKGEAWVELECLRLEPPAVVHLIAQYEQLAPKGRQPEWDDLVGAVAGPVIRTSEIHRWVLTDDGWRRERATRHFATAEPRLHVVR